METPNLDGLREMANKKDLVEKVPSPKPKQAKKEKIRPYVRADMEWILVLQDSFGYATAWVYTHLGTNAHMQNQYRGNVCVVPCAIWKKYHFEKVTWYRCLDNLRGCGAIATKKRGRDKMLVLVSGSPHEPVEVADLEDFPSSSE